MSPAKSEKRGKGGAKKKRRGAAATPESPPWWIAATVGVGLLGLTAWAWPPRPAPEPHVARGNDEYARRQYREALGEYESAPGAGPRNAGVHLDRGLARYRVSVPPPDAGGVPMLTPDASAPEGLTQAQEELRTAARGGTTSAAEDVDAFLRARAAYDLGNTFFSLHHWDNAIETYKEALRLRPSWNDAAWNLELARRLKELERNPPDAGQPDASPPDASPPDAGQPDAGPDSGHDGGGDGGGDSGSQGDGGGGDSGRGDAGNNGDSGRNQGDGGENQPDASADQNPDAGPQQQPDAAAPRSMAPLDDLDRTQRSLQNELLRRRGMQPRGPDDDR